MNNYLQYCAEKRKKAFFASCMLKRDAFFDIIAVVENYNG